MSARFAAQPATSAGIPVFNDDMPAKSSPRCAKHPFGTAFNALPARRAPAYVYPKMSRAYLVYCAKHPIPAGFGALAAARAGIAVDKNDVPVQKKARPAYHSAGAGVYARAARLAFARVYPDVRGAYLF